MVQEFEMIRKLTRKTNDIYIGIHLLGTIRSWDISTINSQIKSSDIIIVSYGSLLGLKEGKIHVSNPTLLYGLPDGDNQDEFPVLFVPHSAYLPEYCEKQLLALDSFDRIIEKNDKISMNSTKLLTVHSLRSILKRINQIHVAIDHWQQFGQDMVTYIQGLILLNPYLGYLPVSERRGFRRESVADTKFAWEIYIRYFIDNWSLDRKVIIPNLSQHYEYEGWQGGFFNRTNPLWKKYMNTHGKLLLNELQRDSIYEIWEQCLLRA